MVILIISTIFHISYYNTQVLCLCRAFANDSSANVKLSKIQLHKIGQSEGVLDKHLEPLLKSGLPLIKNGAKPWRNH